MPVIRTTESSEFYAKLEKYVFIRDEVEINPETNLPDDPSDYVFMDVDDVLSSGTPIDNDGADMVLWGIWSGPYPKDEDSEDIEV